MSREETLEDKKYISIRKAARLSGYSENYLYILKRQDKIPYNQPTPGKILIPEDEFIDWVEEKNNEEV